MTQRKPRPLKKQTMTAKEIADRMLGKLVNNLNANTAEFSSETSDWVCHDDLVLRSIRLAEYAHRNRSKGPHLRKAPKDGDRPYYFVHLAEVASILSAAGCSEELIAAAYCHDVVEDTDYTLDRLEREIGNKKVRDIVEAVSEPDKSLPWKERNEAYLERMRTADTDVLLLSCADKTVNILEMCHWLEKGVRTDVYTSKGNKTQLRKFEQLDEIYRDKIGGPVYDRFADALGQFRSLIETP